MIKKNHDKIKTAIIICLALVLCNLMLMTVAYLQREAKLANTFALGDVKAVVDETFDSKVKSNVSIKNEGNIDAYVRAKILIYFVDSNGNITGEVPKESTDYTISLADENSGWLKVGDCYYFANKVAPGEKTKNLIESCEPLLNSSIYDGGNRKLVVDIAAEAIQANESAVKDAWKSVSVSDGKLIKKQ